MASLFLHAMACTPASDHAEGGPAGGDAQAETGGSGEELANQQPESGGAGSEPTTPDEGNEPARDTGLQEGLTLADSDTDSDTELAESQNLILDDFEGYADDTELAAAYIRAAAGNAASIYLDDAHRQGGEFGGRFEFSVGEPAYAGLLHPIAQDWTGGTAWRFWVDPDGLSRVLVLQFKQASGAYWEHKLMLEGEAPYVVEVPLSEFSRPPWDTSSDELDLSAVIEFNLYAEGEAGDSVLYLDDLEILRSPQ